LFRLWQRWVEEEEVLRTIHDTISGHFCPPGTNGTLHTFRTQSIPWMESYMAQKIVVDAAETAYDTRYPDCVATHTALDAKSADCNAIQVSLQEKACEHEAEIVRVLQKYYEDHAQAFSAYTCAEEEVKELQRDREREWKTLKVVDCLLRRIENQNGVPCETEDGVTEQVGICEELHQLDPCVTDAQFTDHDTYAALGGILAPIYDGSHDLPEVPQFRGVAHRGIAGYSRSGQSILCLDYPPVEPLADFCPSRHEVEASAVQLSSQLLATLIGTLRKWQSQKSCQDSLSHLSQRLTLAATHTQSALHVTMCPFLSLLNSTHAQDTPLMVAPPRMMISH